MSVPTGRDYQIMFSCTISESLAFIEHGAQLQQSVSIVARRQKFPKPTLKTEFLAVLVRRVQSVKSLHCYSVPATRNRNTNYSEEEKTKIKL